MPVAREHFGCLRDHLPVDRIELSHPDSGFAVEVLEYGARMRAIRIPDRRGASVNTILSYATLREYELDTAQIGSTIGRCANRTAALDHPRFQLTCNDGTNHMHGGHVGFSRSLWRTVSCDDGAMPRVQLAHYSLDGHEGYRGNVAVRIDFFIVGPLSLRTVIEATADQATPLNVTLHPYFNLSGDPRTSIEDHELRLASSAFLPIGATQVPTGQIASVEDTPFDFRRPTRIGERIEHDDPQLNIAGGYDHYWPIDADSTVAAELFSPSSGIRLRMSTDQKGLQFYAGNTLEMNAPRTFRTRAGLCLEPHGFPNALNEPSFPSVMLYPGETYRHTTTYTFSLASECSAD